MSGSKASESGAVKSPWRLQDAKARFSEVVRLARDEGPQRVTVHGRDAVVVIDARTYDQGLKRHTGRRLVDLMANSPLAISNSITPSSQGRFATANFERLSFRHQHPVRASTTTSDAAVVAFVAAQPEELLFVSEATFAEIRYGIGKLDDPDRRASLSRWLDRTLQPLFADRVIAVREDIISGWRLLIEAGGVAAM